MASKRPDLKAYFRGRIDWHVHGLMAGRGPSLPLHLRVQGDVTDRSIVVTDTRTGESWEWQGGQYAARKVAGCYAPLMPKPV